MSKINKEIDEMLDDEMEEQIENIKNLDLDYLDTLSDDEAIIEIDKKIMKNDVVLDESTLRALIEQEHGENVLYFAVTGLFKDEKEKAYRSRLSMRLNPPTLEIKDMNENQVNFALTEAFVEKLIASLEEVDNAYYGYKKPIVKKEKIKLSELPKVIINKVSNNPVKAIISALSIIIIAVVLFI